ncbi:MAG: hypothetical protein M3083_24760, partial [Actinomycetota bacterium]|nr:hypothetical protein [Actinomycetota bacterium]
WCNAWDGCNWGQQVWNFGAGYGTWAYAEYRYGYPGQTHVRPRPAPASAYSAVRAELRQLPSRDHHSGLGRCGLRQV